MMMRKIRYISRLEKIEKYLWNVPIVMELSKRSETYFCVFQKMKMMMIDDESSSLHGEDENNFLVSRGSKNISWNWTIFHGLSIGNLP